MKNSNKILLGGAALLALVAVGYATYRIFKKEVKKIEDAEKEDDQELEKLGLSPETVRRDLIPGVDDNNLVKNLFIGVARSPKWNIDVLEGAFDTNTPIYVTQRNSPRGSNSLELFFEIPRLHKASPSIGEYITNFNDLKENIFNTLKFIEEPYSKLEGYFCVEFDDEGEIYDELFPISPDIYASYAKDNHDGLADFVNDFHQNKELQVLIKKGVESPDKPKVLAVEAILMWKLSFRISNSSSEPWTLGGMNLPLGLKALEVIINDFTFTRKGKSSDRDAYKNFIFVPPIENDGFRYYERYCLTSNGQVTEESFTIDL